MSMKPTSLICLAVVLALGCHSLTPVQQARADVFECRARALEPLVVAEGFDASEVLRQIYSGAASLGSIAGALNASEDEIAKIDAALEECAGHPNPSASAPGESTL